MNITPHFVVPDAAEAAAWYQRAFTAREQSRVPLPGSKVMAVVMRIGEFTFQVGSESCPSCDGSPSCQNTLDDRELR